MVRSKRSSVARTEHRRTIRGIVMFTARFRLSGKMQLKIQEISHVNPKY